VEVVVGGGGLDRLQMTMHAEPVDTGECDTGPAQVNISVSYHGKNDPFSLSNVSAYDQAIGPDESSSQGLRPGAPTVNQFGPTATVIVDPSQSGTLEWTGTVSYSYTSYSPFFGTGSTTNDTVGFCR
jgi:hypothetical protein